MLNVDSPGLDFEQNQKKKFKKYAKQKYNNFFSFFPPQFLILAEPFPLMDLCRRVIRQKIGRERLESCVHQLQLPESMKTYLLYWDRR